MRVLRDRARSDYTPAKDLSFNVQVILMYRRSLIPLSLLGFVAMLSLSGCNGNSGASPTSAAPNGQIFALTISSVSPANNATCVSDTTAITITFDRAPDASTLTASNLTVAGPNGAVAVKMSTGAMLTQAVLTRNLRCLLARLQGQ